MVTTNMSKDPIAITKTPGLFIITPEECVKSSLRDLGYDNETYGHWKHHITAFFAAITPFSAFCTVSK